jgi:hypothetical protein
MNETPTWLTKLTEKMIKLIKVEAKDLDDIKAANESVTSCSTYDHNAARACSALSNAYADTYYAYDAICISSYSDCDADYDSAVANYHDAYDALKIMRRPSNNG